MAVKREKSFLVECSECNAKVDARVRGSYGAYGEDGPAALFSLLECGQCHSPVLVVQEEFGGQWDPPTRIYPARERDLGSAVPEGIRTAFTEAQACFRAQAYTACAIMCRKVLEGIGKHFEPKGRILNATLKVLKDKHEIDDRLYQWATALRMAGNDAAHNINVTVSKEDAQDVLDFSEALAEYLFTFREKYAQFQKRRQSPPSRTASA